MTVSVGKNVWSDSVGDGSLSRKLGPDYVIVYNSVIVVHLLSVDWGGGVPQIISETERRRDMGEAALKAPVGTHPIHA